MIPHRVATKANSQPPPGGRQTSVMCKIVLNHVESCVDFPPCIFQRSNFPKTTRGKYHKYERCSHCYVQLRKGYVKKTCIRGNPSRSPMARSLISPIQSQRWTSRKAWNWKWNYTPWWNNMARWFCTKTSQRSKHIKNISLFSGANMFQFRTNMNVLFESRISRYRVWKVWKIIFIDLTSHYLTVLLSFQVSLRIPGWDNGGCWGRAVRGATYQNGSISSDLWELFFVLPEIWQHEIHFWFLLFCDAIDSHCVYCIYHKNI